MGTQPDWRRRLGKKGGGASQQNYNYKFFQFLQVLVNAAKLLKFGNKYFDNLKFDLIFGCLLNRCKQRYPNQVCYQSDFSV